MAGTNNIGTQRLVVGAHYGSRDWLAQRVTAILMGVYMLVLLVQLLWPRYARDFNGERLTEAGGAFVRLTGYDRWAGIFSAQWMKFLTFVVIVAMLYHVWVGIRDVLMDYVKPFGARLALQIATLVWLVGCSGWAIQVLWRL
jgi:succinate dehydrogenase / fumarate reductase membrane anchor subunit